MRDTLLAVEAAMKRDALDDHRHAEFLWAVLAAGGRSTEPKGPTPPPILRD